MSVMKMTLISDIYPKVGGYIGDVTVGKVYEVDQREKGYAHFRDDKNDPRRIRIDAFVATVQKLDDGNSDQPQRILFNLERALAGDPVVRRDGVKVSEVLRFKGGNVLKPVVSLAENGGFFLHNEDGKLFEDAVDLRDLFMAPKTKTIWVNLYNFPKADELPDVLKGRNRTGPGINTGELRFDAPDMARQFALRSPSASYYLKSVSVEVPA